jgi:hypothetical protein
VNDDLLENDDLHIVVIKVQAQKWRTQNKDSISWRLFVVNGKSIYYLVN